MVRTSVRFSQLLPWEETPELGLNSTNNAVKIFHFLSSYMPSDFQMSPQRGNKYLGIWTIKALISLQQKVKET